MAQGRKKYYLIQETAYRWLPAEVFLARAGENVRLGFLASCPATERDYREADFIFLTPNQASAMAAWLADEADRLRATAARTRERRMARIAARAKRTTTDDSQE